MGADTSTLKGVNNNAQLQRERFELASDDFTLDKEALKKFFKCSDRECNILFEHFDMDRNGKIDSYEFVCAMAMLSHSTLEEKAELIFTLYDFDGSKYISRDELVILMTNALTALKSMQKKPAPSIQEIEQKTDEFFLKSDVDQDKKITLQEFKNYITKDKQILEVLLNCNVAKKEDLGMDFGSGGGQVPDIDKDLEAECNPKELTDKKAKVKEGVDFKVKQDGDMFEEEQMGQGDQFMAVKPWIGVIKNSVPTKYKPNPRDGEAPDATLQLEHIYGYRCHDTRNNLRYAANGNIVYHAAGVGIVHDLQSNTQKFFLEHNDDIHCIALDPTGKFCATGQIGPKPWLCIWSNDTMECVARIQGTLLKGVMQVAFSNDGKYIAASAMDDDHNIAIYDWQTKPKAGQAIKPIASGKGTRANILSLGFNPTNNEIVATCVKEVNFFSFQNGVLKGQKGVGWGTTGAESVLCQAYVDNVLVTGTFSGNLILWNGRNISGKPIKAHAECVNAMYPRKAKKGIITGGNDGMIIAWTYNGTFQMEKSFDIKVQEVRSLLPKVRSVCENSTNGLILVGTRGGEIMEFGGQKPMIHMRSHCDGELWGLASHPSKAEFITIGQDNMLAIWDINAKRQKKFARLDCAGNVLSFNHDGTKLAIGYTNGSLTVLDANFQVIVIRKDRKEAIQEIKFSPDSSICAVGAHDSMIFTYDVINNFKPLKKLRGHHSTITHFDFSLDGRYLMSNCTSYEILFFDVGAGKQNTGGASQLKDETWSTWTCTLGWPVQGIFPPCADGSDINSCHRSPDGTVVATADDFGMVKLFRYPCPLEKASFNQYVGHSSHVTNVRFVPKAPYLISTGGEDKSIFQWKYFLDKESQAESAKSSKTKVDTKNIQQDMGGDAFNDDMIFEEQQMEEGDQRLAVLPFKGEIMAPSGYKMPKDASNPPNGNLKLKYAHGFRSFDTRGNLKYTKTGEVAFTTAALGVVLNKQANTQKFFNLHEDDVVAMALHPNKEIIATGQMAAKNKAKVIDIFVWNASTQECLAQINGFHRRAIRNLAFSPSGDKLLSIGEDDFHSVAIYDWVNKRMLSNAKVDPDKVFDAVWKDETEFMTVGMKHVKFFTIQGQNITASKGLYGAMGPTPMICCNYVFDTKVSVTGTPTGELVAWGGRTISKAHKGHTDALWQILSVQNNSMLISGGNDAKIIFWDKNFAQKKVIDLTPMSKFSAGVRSLDYSEQAKTILVGTRGSEIIEIDSSTGAKSKTLIYGHFEGTKQAELWGCAVHPNQQMFASCGADSTVRIWSENTMLKASEPFTNDLTACDWSSNGLFLVVGDRNGYVHTVNADTLAKLSTSKSFNADQKNAWVEDVKIAPNCQILAFGTHGGRSKVDLVKILDNGKKLQPIKSVDIQISSSLTHLDWSLDSNAVVVNSQAYELMWLDVNSQKRIMASGAKDIEFATWTCVLGFPVQGIWPGPDFTDVNSTCRSNSRQVLATADDFGKVKLFKYPCSVENASFNQYQGHSSHVTKVKFSANDKFVVSTGGNDKTVLIWKTDFALDDPNSSKIKEEETKQFDPKYDDDDGFVESRIDKSKIDKQNAKELEKQKTKKKPQAQEDDFFEMQDVGEGDEFMAVKPWIGQMKEPTGFQKPPKNQNMAPNVQVNLEWVHGYRSRDAKNNITYLVDGSIAYHAAGLGVIYDPTEHTQRFFNMHTDDVTAIAYSSDKRTIATGELGAKPSIYIWDGITMTMKYQLKGKLLKGIQGLAFSPSGKILAGVAMDDNHSIAVYNVESGAFIAMTNGDKAIILELAFKNDNEFASAGVKHFMQWKVGSNLTSTRGNFAKSDPRIGSCAYSGDNCLTGSITGELYIWSGSSIKATKKLHEKPLDAIFCNSLYVLTGGRDCKVNVLQATNLTPLFTFTIDETQYNSISGVVRALCLNETNNQLLVGTYGSEIYSVPIDIGKKTCGAPKVITQGHYSPCRKDNNEAWGMTSFPKKDFYATCSDDATLRVWDINGRKQIRIIKLNLDHQGKEMPLDPETQEISNATKARCLDISPDEKFCAVGFRDGSFRIYDILQNWQFSAKKNPSKKVIGDIKFSPNGQFLAVASHDCKIYIYAVPSLQQKCILNKSTAFVTHIDWSLDSNTIHSNDASYEILYYNVSSGSQDTGGASSCRDEFWHTWTCILGWPVQGVWPPGVDGTDINAVDRSKRPHPDGYHLVATADDFSKVKVFRYPSMIEDSQCIEGKGHSSHVTQVKFSKDDKYLFSAGGNDTCIFQWKIEQ